MKTEELEDDADKIDKALQNKEQEAYMRSSDSENDIIGSEIADSMKRFISSRKYRKKNPPIINWRNTIKNDEMVNEVVHSSKSGNVEKSAVPNNEDISRVADHHSGKVSEIESLSNLGSELELNIAKEVQDNSGTKSESPKKQNKSHIIKTGNSDKEDSVFQELRRNSSDPSYLCKIQGRPRKTEQTLSDGHDEYALEKSDNVEELKSVDELGENESDALFRNNTVQECSGTAKMESFLNQMIDGTDLESSKNIHLSIDETLTCDSTKRNNTDSLSPTKQTGQPRKTNIIIHSDEIVVRPTSKVIEKKSTSSQITAINVEPTTLIHSLENDTSVAGSVQTLSDSISPKKRPSRPRKSNINIHSDEIVAKPTSNANEKNPTSNHIAAINDEDSTLIQSLESDTSVTASVETLSKSVSPRKRAGRPRKTNIIIHSDETVVEPASDVNEKSQTSNEIAAISVEDSTLIGNSESDTSVIASVQTLSQSVSPRKHPGRPRKTNINIHSDETVVEPASKDNEKSPTSNEIAAISVEDGTLIDSLETDTSVTASVQTLSKSVSPGKRPGRPRKTNINIDSDQTAVEPVSDVYEKSPTSNEIAAISVEDSILIGSLESDTTITASVQTLSKSVSPRKRPGRPRKTNINIHSDETVVEPASKVIEKSPTSNEIAAISVEESALIGSLESDTSVIASDQTLCDSTLPKKHHHGRPKRTNININSDETVVEPASKVNEKSPTSNEIASSSVENSTLIGRLESDTSVIASDQTLSDSMLPKKRRRGRPKRTNININSDETVAASNVNEEKTTSGLISEINVEDSTLIDSLESDTSVIASDQTLSDSMLPKKRGRGRPKKTNININSDETVVESIVNEEQTTSGDIAEINVEKTATIHSLEGDASVTASVHTLSESVPVVKKRGRKRKADMVDSPPDDILQKVAVSRRGRIHKPVDYFKMENPDLSEPACDSQTESLSQRFQDRRPLKKQRLSDNLISSASLVSPSYGAISAFLKENDGVDKQRSQEDAAFENNSQQSVTSAESNILENKSVMIDYVESSDEPQSTTPLRKRRKKQTNSNNEHTPVIRPSYGAVTDFLKERSEVIPHDESNANSNKNDTLEKDVDTKNSVDLDAIDQRNVEDASLEYKSQRSVTSIESKIPENKFENIETSDKPQRIKPLKKRKEKVESSLTSNNNTSIVSPSYGAVMDFLKESGEPNVSPCLISKFDKNDALEINKSDTIDYVECSDKPQGMTPLKKRKEKSASPLNSNNQHTSVISPSYGAVIDFLKEDSITHDESTVSHCFDKNELDMRNLVDSESINQKPVEDATFEYQSQRNVSKIPENKPENIDCIETLDKPQCMTPLKKRKPPNTKSKDISIVSPDYIAITNSLNKSSEGNAQESISQDESNHSPLPMSNFDNNDSLENEVDINKSENNLDNSSPESSIDPEVKQVQVRVKKPRGEGDTVKMMKSLFVSSDLITVSKLEYNHSLDDVQEPKNRRGAKRKLKPLTSMKEVICAICQQKMDNNRWQMHKLQVHNTLAWRVDDKPLELTNQKLVISILQKVAKRYKKLYCYKCRIVMKSVVGFLSHIAICGKTPKEIEDLKEPCPYCEKRFLPASLTAHYYQVHNGPKAEKLSNKESDLLPREKEKRKAASKAMSNIQDASTTESLVGDINKDDEFPIELKSYVLYLGAPRITCIKKYVEEKLALQGYVICFYDGCNFKSETLEIMDHLKRCEMKVEKPILCKLCLNVFSGKITMYKHLIETHNLQDPREVLENDDEDCKRLEKTGREIKNTVLLAKQNVCFNRIKERSCRGIMFPNAYVWTTEFLKEHMSQTKLFTNERFSKNGWYLLNPDLVENYLPVMSESCDTARLVYKKSFNPVNKKHEFKKFQLFESEIYPDGNCIVFCGGPVCSLAWLPVFPSSTDQILAVSTLKTPDQVLYLYENYRISSVIQFWNFGKLMNVTKNTYKPKLIFSLAIDFGPVWYMEWCPSGCYNPDTDDKDVNHPPRLGLLAVAGSDSSVCIFSVPVSNENEEMLFYKAAPIQKLCLRKSNDNSNSEGFYATKISWSKGGGHKFIAVGYSNGIVALFDLTAYSELLTGPERSGILYPYLTFQAHLQTITGLHVHYLNELPRWLMSASKDKFLKIWDLTNTNIPLTAVKRGAISDAIWLNHWLGQVISYDEGTSRTTAKNLTGCSYKSLRDVFGEANTVLPASSTVTALAASDWLNCVMQCDQAGEILAIFPDHYLSLLDDKFMRRKKLLLSYTMLIGKKNEAKAEEVKKSQQASTKDNVASNDNANCDGDSLSSQCPEPYHYQEAQEKYGLVFCDGNMNDYKHFCQQKNESRDWSKILTVSDTRIYPLQAVTKLTLNPNKQATTYYAAGYQAGFVRLSCIEFLKTDILSMGGL